MWMVRAWAALLGIAAAVTIIAYALAKPWWELGFDCGLTVLAAVNLRRALDRPRR
jgi:hypothetical protein